ncbi:MAG: tetrahydrofolate dehydrogenase/cyclohydrolase catalytic domain-containing protein [Vicingaceae bacterium]
MQLIKGKVVADEIKVEIAEEVRQLTSRGVKKPHLAAVLVGNDGASKTYVASKVKACKLVGFNSSLIELPHDTTEQKILQTVSELNDNEDIDGFIVQLPLPDHIDEQKVTMAIDPEKDVDGFHPASLGKMMLNLPTFISATPMGILKLLERYDIETSGKHCVVIGRSHIVGMPMSVLMARKEKIGNCTVTLTHSRTKNLADHTRRADILIVALGKAQFLKANMIKKGAVVIDVGITRVVDPSKKSGYRLLGDVDFDEVAPLCSYITPVPGGVGPMTIASLLLNTLQAVKRKT